MKPKLAVLPSAPVIGLTTASTSVTLKLVICLSTLTLDSRPWWHVMQRASGPRLSIVLPEGNVTEVRAMAAGLWQVVQLNVPAGAGTSAVTLPLAAKSWNPCEVWQRAQSAGTAAAVLPSAGLFQWLKASA